MESEAITVEPAIVRQFAALLDSRFAALSGEIRADAREDTNSVREAMRESAASIRKEMRFLAAGMGIVMATGFLYLNARMTDLSGALARVETDLALLLERIP